MPKLIHWRTVEGGRTDPNTTGCGDLGFNVPDTDAVTCPNCKSLPLFQLTALRHREVVDALSSPKENHPCLTPHQPR